MKMDIMEHNKIMLGEELYLYNNLTNTLIKICIITKEEHTSYFIIVDEIFGMDRAVQKWEEFENPPDGGIATIQSDVLLKCSDFDLESFMKLYLPALLL